MTDIDQMHNSTDIQSTMIKSTEISTPPRLLINGNASKDGDDDQEEHNAIQPSSKSIYNSKCRIFN